MDPIQQILAQAMAPKGSAGNAGSLFLQGAQLGMSRRNQAVEQEQRQQHFGQEDQRIGLANRRMNLDEEQFSFTRDLQPQLKEVNRLKIDEAKLDIQTKTNQVARDVEIKRGSARAGELLVAMTQYPGLIKNDLFWNEVNDLFSSNAAVAESHNGKTLLGSLRRGGLLKEGINQIRESLGVGSKAVTRYGLNAAGDMTVSVTDDPNAAARLKIATDNATLRERDLNARVKRAEASLSPESRMLLKEQLVAYSGDALILAVPEGADELTWGAAMREKVFNEFMQKHGRGVTDMTPGQPGSAADPLGLFK